MYFLILLQINSMFMKKTDFNFDYFSITNWDDYLKIDEQNIGYPTIQLKFFIIKSIDYLTEIQY